MATSEVDFPDQVGQVTRYNHFFAPKIFFLTLSAMSVNIKSSTFFAVQLIFLIAIPILPIVRKAFTLYGVPVLD